MISIKEAEKINETVRSAFKKGGKSGNKAYTDAVGTEIDAVAMTALLVPKVTGAFNKQDLRNNNAAVGSMFIDDVRRQGLIGISVKNAVDYGKLLWYFDSSTLCGNCTEMACMAAYLVSEEDRSCNIWIVSTDSPGDHVFCAVGPGTGWKVTMKLEELLDKDRKVIIVDPWASTCAMAKRLHGGVRTEDGQMDVKWKTHR